MNLEAIEMIDDRLLRCTESEELDRLLVIRGNLEKGWRIRQKAIEEMCIDPSPRASMQSWEEAVYAPITDGTAVTAAAKTALIPDFTLPAGYMYPGRWMKYTLYGKMSTVITTPGTWTHTLNWGGSAGIVLASTAAYAPDSAAASTNIAWWIEYLLHCRATGAVTSGSIFCMGKFQMGDFSSTVATLAAQLDQETFPDAPAAVGVDTTTAKALTPAITPSVATGSITAHLALLEAIT
jgi:hypothetical protein